MTINDLAFEMVKDKEDIKAIKKLEKQIKAWEDEKVYPTLDDIYKMAYIIKINPGELLAIRNRGRKQFYRESDDPPKRKHDWIEISDNASMIFSCLSKAFGFFSIILVVVVGYKFYDVFFGGTAGFIEHEVMYRDIQKYTEPENMVNDGTVSNMVRRLKKEQQEKMSGKPANSSNEIVNEEVDNYSDENTLNIVN